MAHDVFISYSSNDKAAADAICESIEAAGPTCWIAPRNIRAGDTWGSAIINAISDSRAMVLILSGSANGSRQVLREAERAVQKDVVLIPIRIEEIDPSSDLEYFISATHWYDAYTPPLENHLQPFADIVKSVVDEQRGQKVQKQRPKQTGKDSAPKTAAMPAAESTTQVSNGRPRYKMIFSTVALIVVGLIALVLWKADFFQNGNQLAEEGPKLSAPESDKATGQELNTPGTGVVTPERNKTTGTEIKATAAKPATPESVKTSGAKLKTPGEGLAAPESVTAGAMFKVAWAGPNNSGDYITIVKAGAPEKTYLNYAYTKDGNPANLRALDEPGAYELRYIMGQSQSTLARTPITVKAVSSELKAPGEVTVGSMFKVAWTGPNNSGDYVTIVKAGAAEKTYLNYAYTKDGSPAKLRAVDEPGAYELRYIMGQSGSTLSRLPITVKATSAELKAPATVTAGSFFKVAWTGPNNSGDYVTIVKAGAPEKTYLNYAYTKDGSPAKLRALDEPGAYELRYITGQSQATLARATIQVKPAKAALQKID